MKPLPFFALIRHVFSLNIFSAGRKPGRHSLRLGVEIAAVLSLAFSCAGTSFFAISHDKGNGALCFLRRKEPLAFVRLLQAVCNSRPDYAV